MMKTLHELLQRKKELEEQRFNLIKAGRIDKVNDILIELKKVKDKADVIAMNSKRDLTLSGDDIIENKLIKCNVCEIDVSVNALVCPNCGEPLKQTQSSEFLEIFKKIFLIGILIILFIAFGIPLLKAFLFLIGLIILAIYK